MTKKMITAAIILAALGWSLRSASSPKYEFSLYSHTILSPPVLSYFLRKRIF